MIIHLIIILYNFHYILKIKILKFKYKHDYLHTLCNYLYLIISHFSLNSIFLFRLIFFILESHQLCLGCISVFVLRTTPVSAWETNEFQEWNPGQLPGECPNLCTITQGPLKGHIPLCNPTADIVSYFSDSNYIFSRFCHQEIQDE